MKYLNLDIRALSLMRIGIAFLLMLDLSIRLNDLEAFYSNTGVAPLSMIFENAWNDYYISLHTISGLWQVQFLIFCFAFFCALMLFIGYRTKLFTFLSWIMLLSLHNRNEIILQGGDDLLRLTLFWAMFLPWGSRYSYDSTHNINENSLPLQIRNWATLAYLLQISYVYTGSALLKGAEWNTDFTALYYVYSLDQIAYPVSHFFYTKPELMKVLTAIAYYFELFVPLLFFFPFKNGLFRLIAFIFITGFHLFNGFTVFIGLFFLIGITSTIGILPTFALDYFDRITARLKPIFIQSFNGIAYPLKYIIKWRPQKAMNAFTDKVNTGILIFLVLFVFYWNLSNIPSLIFKPSENIKPLAYSLRLDQCWGMFAPNVFKDDGWFIYEATTFSGEHFDLLHPKNTLTFNKTECTLYSCPNDRWRKYGENYILADHDFMRGYFCNYKMRTWNEKHPERKIKTLSVIYMSEFSQPDYKYSKPEKIILFECGE
ncbi:MAG: hypothetical protein H7321_03740 [Bacteroidia bacterium]|nr:hypothetical protein [Bacteroidia bacterium]